MSLSLSEERTKVLLKQVFSELLEENRAFFTEIMTDALEDIGLANAIREGRQGDFVSEEEILAMLESQS